MKGIGKDYFTEEYYSTEMKQAMAAKEAIVTVKGIVDEIMALGFDGSIFCTQDFVWDYKLRKWTRSEERCQTTFDFWTSEKIGRTRRQRTVK